MAEFVTLLSIVSSLVGAVDHLVGDKTSDAWQRIYRPSCDETPYLSVFDVSHTGEPEITWLIDTGGQHVSNQQSPANLQALPAQEIGSFRFHIVEDFGNRPKFGEHVSGELQETLAAKDYPYQGLPSFTRLRSQWHSPAGSLAWSSTSYGTSGLSEADNSSDKSLWFFSKLMRLTKSVRITKDSRGCFQVVIRILPEAVNLDHVFPNHPSKPYPDAKSRPERKDVHLLLSHFCESLKSEITAEPFNQLWKHTDTDDALIQLVLICFCRSNLMRLSDSIDTVRTFRAHFRETTTDPRRTTTSISSTQDMVRDAYLYDELQGCVSDLTSATSSLLEILSIAFRTQLHAEFDSMAADTRAICSDLTHSSSRLCARLDRHISLFQLLRSFKESQGVWVLGLLASIFLPLSLAAGLLSMQTRLLDLHLIFYDFCGVIVLIGTLVLVIIAMLNVYVRLNEQLLKSRNDPTFRRLILPAIGVGVLVCCIMTWSLLLSSFLVGMVKNVGLGLKILGYGAAVIGGMVLLGGLGASAMWTLLKKLYGEK